MQHGIHFISGLPRSGSTLLAAILRQNPDFHAAMTSPVGALFSAMLRQMSAEQADDRGLHEVLNSTGYGQDRVAAPRPREWVRDFHLQARLYRWLLRLAPNRPLLLTDYAPATVARVAELLPEPLTLVPDDTLLFDHMLAWVATAPEPVRHGDLRAAGGTADHPKIRQKNPHQRGRYGDDEAGRRGQRQRTGDGELPARLLRK